jgi:hypothetical protein
MLVRGMLVLAGLETLLGHCTTLSTLSLKWCTQVNDSWLGKLADGCKQLVDLDLMHCDGVTDVGITKLARGRSRALLI